MPTNYKMNKTQRNKKTAKLQCLCSSLLKTGGPLSALNSHCPADEKQSVYSDFSNFCFCFSVPTSCKLCHSLRLSVSL